MELLWKAAAGVLITVILSLVLGKRDKDLSLLLTMAVCCMVCMLALRYLEPILEFLRELETLGSIQMDMLEILLKAVGISLVGEIAALICIDGGNASLGKTFQLLTNTAILYLSLPILRTMLDLLQKILGAL